MIEQQLQRAIAWWLTAPMHAGYALALLLVTPATVFVTALLSNTPNS